jgi:hypothetical protein
VKYSPALVNQPLFPRSWVNHIDRCYQTFYPSTHDGNFHTAVAVIGDSYGAGDGDEFLDGLNNYGIFHKLKFRTGERYLIYARGGFGSINAAKEIVFCMNAMNNSILLPSIGNPKEIIVLFYEGNDLDNNIRHLRMKNEGQSIESFVQEQVLANDWGRIIQMHVALFNLLEELFEDLLFSVDFQKIAKQLIGSSTYADSKEIPGGRQTLDSATDATITHENQVVVGNTPHAVPLDLQSAAIELSENKLNDALQVFQNSVLVLQSYFQNISIDIVYLPSVVTCYQWKGKIQVQAYHSKDTVFTTTEENEIQSRHIRESIRIFAEQHRMRFIDPTSLLQSEAHKHFIHGPKDWKHFNSVGYQLVADAL